MRQLAVAILLATLAVRASGQGAPSGAPVLNDMAASVSATGAVVTWATDQPSDTQVDYGSTTAYGQSTPLNPAFVVSHTAALAGLIPGAIYHYRARSRNAAGAPGMSTDYTFTVPAPGAAPLPPAAAGTDGPPAVPAVGTVTPAPSPDTEKTPPSVVVMTPAAGSFVSKTVAVSANATDNVGVTSVQFLLDGGSLGTPLTSAPYTFQWDTSATSDGPHSLSVVASDASGNSATSTVIPITVDNAPPELKEVSSALVGPSAVVVRWKTSERADARVDYGTTTAYGLTAKVNGSHMFEHGAGLTGLAPGIEYHFRVTSRDQAGNQAISADAVFKTEGGAASSAAASAADDAAAMAPQQMLSPSRADGINDAARFGPEAREVSIFDIHGRRVFHATSSSAASPIVWDCRDGAGRVLESGVYLATIVKRDGGKLTQSFSIAK